MTADNDIRFEEALHGMQQEIEQLREELDKRLYDPSVTLASFCDTLSMYCIRIQRLKTLHGQYVKVGRYNE